MVNCYLLTQTVLLMKSNQMFVKNFLSRNICLTLAIFEKFYDCPNTMNVGKTKIVYKGIPINKFIGLISKIHAMLSDDGKETNTAKGVNIAAEFKEFKDTLYNKKVVRHKVKRI